MTLNLTNLFYSEKDIGATLKISKRQFIWEFDLNGSSQRIELLDSRFSRKKRLFKNGVSILDTIETGNFVHNFEIDGHSCVIIQYGDKIELRIDNQSFTHLYNLQKNKELFAGEKGPTSNIYVAKPFNSGNSSEDKNTENAFYKNKPEEDNKPKLFNFEIKKGTGNKSSGGGFNKFKFGGNKEQTSSSSNANLNNNKSNGNVDLLGFQNNNNNNNQNINNINNNNSNNNNLLDFGGNNNNNQQNNGNDVFDLLGNNNQNSNNNTQQNQTNQFNNIFLQLTDGNNQEQKFDQNNLGFLDFNNMNNNQNNNNNNIQIQNQQMNQNNNNTQNNQANSGNNADFLQF